MLKPFRYIPQLIAGYPLGDRRAVLQAASKDAESEEE